MKTARVIAISLLAALLSALGRAEATAPAPETEQPKVAPAADKPGKKLDGVAATPTAAPKPPPLSPRFQQVRNRIDALFSNRNSRPPPLDPRHNPFRPAGPFVAAPVVAGEIPRTGATTVEPITNDQTILQEAVASLKLGGRFEVGGREHRMINGRLYKEGDAFPAQVSGQTVYLRVKALTQKSVTLTLNTAESTIPL